MTDIKMTDVFELPLEVEGQEIYDQGCGEILTTNFSSTKADPILDYAVIAINAYDTNQARIAELEAEVKLLKGCNKTPSVSPAITAGCYCTDIKNMHEGIETHAALMKLGFVEDGGITSFSHRIYRLKQRIGISRKNGLITYDCYEHATTLVSHLDIIKAAEGL